MTKLHQTIAVEKGVKTRALRFLTDAYKEFQKEALFKGESKVYEKKDEDGEDFPPERQLVQRKVLDMLMEISEQSAEYFDVVATKDEANCRAKADVVVDGVTLLRDIPATHLLFLEKQLVDLNTAIDSVPVLDPAYTWQRDEATGMYRSEPVRTTKMKKVHEAIVLYPHSEQHPAQTQMVQVDKTIGTWITVKQSGAITADRKKELQTRARKLLKAVKYAREEANSVETTSQQVGQKIFDYLLA